MNKYRNVKTIVDDIPFASKAEAKRYTELKLLWHAGQINILHLQPQFDFILDGEKMFTYRADFSYFDENGLSVVEDVKGGNATKTPVYRLKKKLIEKQFKIQIRET